MFLFCCLRAFSVPFEKQGLSVLNNIPNMIPLIIYLSFLIQRRSHCLKRSCQFVNVTEIKPSKTKTKTNRQNPWVAFPQNAKEGCPFERDCSHFYLKVLNTGGGGGLFNNYNPEKSKNFWDKHIIWELRSCCTFLPTGLFFLPAA